MKRILSLMILVVTALAGACAGSADALLGRAAEKLKDAKSLTADYVVTADGESMHGTITVAGDKFKIDSKQLKSWYDGKTQWTYSAEIDEVNVVEPTEEELAQVNPFAIVSSFRSRYDSRIISIRDGVATVELLPKSKSEDMKKGILTLSEKTLFPSKVVIYMSSGSTLTITVKSISEGMVLPASHFRFSPSMLPGVEVIDLR